MGSDVFISYAQGDREIADAVCRTLESVGVQCWIAPRDIPAGSDWRTSIVNAIRDTKLFVLVFSAKSNESDNVPREVSIALRNGKIVLPLRTEDAEPAGALQYSIGDAQWVDAVARPIDPCLHDLLTVVQGHLSAGAGDFGGRGTPTRSDVPPPRPAVPAVAPAPPPERQPEPVIVVGAGGGSGSRLLGFAVAGLVILACAVLIAVLLSRSTKPGAAVTTEAPVTTNAPTTTTTVAPTTSAAPPTTTRSDLRLATTQIEQMLVDATNGFTKLNQEILTPALGCRMSGVDAASRMDAVISNRQNIINSLNALHYSNQIANDLVGQFRHAIQLSLDSDFSYQTWARDAGSACPSSSAPEWAGASNIGRGASAAKQSFADTFNPVAASFHMKADWTKNF